MTLDRQIKNPANWLVFGIILFFLAGSACASTNDIKGLVEPIKSIELATEESGTIAQVYVIEGQSVSEGEVLAKLDDELQQVQLELAAHLAESSSGLAAAASGLEKREMITRRIRDLRASGNASESELIRTEMELTIAKAKYSAAKEELVARQIEMRRAEIQLKRRQIKAPFSGVVSSINYHEGEYLSPIRPEFLTLVQVDELLAVFPLPVSLADSFKNKKTIKVQFSNSRLVTGEIHSIGVTADAGSNTVSLKVKIDNKNGLIRSGEECFLKY